MSTFFRPRWRDYVPITVRVGTPLRVADDIAGTDAALRESMTALLHRVQENYLHPAGAYWVPGRLGGGAPTRAEAAQIEADEAAAKAAARAQRPGQ